MDDDERAAIVLLLRARVDELRRVWADAGAAPPADLEDVDEALKAAERALLVAGKGSVPQWMNALSPPNPSVRIWIEGVRDGQIQFGYHCTACGGWEMTLKGEGNMAWAHCKACGVRLGRYGRIKLDALSMSLSAGFKPLLSDQDRQDFSIRPYK